MLPKRARLTSPADFRRVRSEGRCGANDLLVVCTVPNGSPVSRFGFSVSRRIGGAVVRSRVKRLMSETVRLQYDLIQPGWDVVCIARRGIGGAGYAEVQRAVSELLARAGLYASEPEGQSVADGQRS